MHNSSKVDDFWAWKEAQARAQRSTGGVHQTPAPILPSLASSVGRPSLASFVLGHAVKPTPLIVPPPAMAASDPDDPPSATLKPPTNDDQWTRPTEASQEELQDTLVAPSSASGGTSSSDTGVTELTERFNAFTLTTQRQEESVAVIELGGVQVSVSELSDSLGMPREAVIAMYRAQKAKEADGKFKNPFNK